jgi:hypothetical protein
MESLRNSSLLVKLGVLIFCRFKESSFEVVKSLKLFRSDGDIFH